MQETLDPSVSEWSASICFQGQSCILTYSGVTDCITVNRIAEGEETTRLLNVPRSIVLNFETQDECEERQRIRGVTDTSVKVQFAKKKYSFLHRAAKEQNNYVFAHSRANTGVIPPPADSEDSAGNLSREGSRKRHVDVSIESYRLSHPYSAVYYLHYIRMEPNGRLKSIHSLRFTANLEEDHRDMELLISRLTARLYEQGTKNILLFVSPVSGKGEGLTVVNQTVAQILHFTKHSIEMIVTDRAHHCEDYLADLSNRLNQHYVVAAVGGDGMINEIVNGIYRRKLAYIENYRANEASEKGSSEPSSATHLRRQLSPKPDDESSDDGGITSVPSAPSVRGRYLTAAEMLRGWDTVLPLVATIPTGSACGLAKGLDELHPLAATLALVRCSTVHSDLLHFRFSSNPPLLEFHESKLSNSTKRRAVARYEEYRKNHHEDLERVKKQCSPLVPFLPNGRSVFTDPISHHIGAPLYTERVAFMSLSYGVPNDIDRGSENLRWMGNVRFAVYGGLCVIRGPASYKGRVRYLPWTMDNGKTVEKISAEDPLPSPEEIPLCTNREDCPFCMRYSGYAPLPAGSPISCSSSFNSRRKPSTLQSNQEIMEETPIDFNDDSLPWKTVEGEFHMLMACAIKDVAQDAVMAPMAHLRDGSMDLVFCMKDNRYGRKDFVNFLNALKDGKHIHQPFTGYIKARAAEITVEGGLVMGDGEMLTLGKVQLTIIRRGVNFVRGE